MRGLGTLLNLAAIAAGASVGALLGDRLPGRLRETLVAALGLFTLALGVQQALAAVLLAPLATGLLTAVQRP